VKNSGFSWYLICVTTKFNYEIPLTAPLLYQFIGVELKNITGGITEGKQARRKPTHYEITPENIKNGNRNYSVQLMINGPKS
jgi:hypothetical protein